MKFESFPSHESVESSIELPSRFKESMNNLRERFGKFMPIALLSALAFLPNKMKAQNSDSIQSKKYSHENLLDTKENKEAERQRAWLVEYIHSPKYKERLTREVLHNNTLETLKYSSDTALPEEVWPTMGIPENLPSAVSVEVDSQIALRAEAASTATFKIIEEFEEEGQYGEYFKDSALIGATEVQGGDFGLVYMLPHSVALKREGPANVNSSPVHEITHASLRASKFITASTDSAFQKWTQPFDWATRSIATPEEIIPRLNSLRFMLKEEGLYDAGEFNFTVEDLQKMKQNERVMNEMNVQQLLNNVLKGSPEEKEKTLIWIMNNVADASTPVLGIGEEREARSV